MKNIHKFIRFTVIAAILTAPAFTACYLLDNIDNQTGDNQTGNSSGFVAVTGVMLDQTRLALTAGDTAFLTARVKPANASNQDVSWYSSNPGIAAVDNGAVTAVSAGNATITVITAEGNKTAVCTVTVTGSGAPDLEGTITISPDTDVKINTELTATYS